MKAMHSDKRKTTIYLKSEDKKNVQQCQKELNILFKQEFHNSDVYHTATAMIRARTNIMPSCTALLKQLAEERDLLGAQIPSDIINYFRQYM